MPDTPQPLAHQVPEAARLIGCSVRTLYTLAERGEIELVKIGRRTVIRRSELERYLDGLQPLHTSGGDAA